MTVWLSKFFPQMAQWDFSTINLTGKLIYKLALGVFIFLLIIAGRKWKSNRRYIIVFTTGLQGMVLEIILILNYQIHNGILFQNIGILIMGFMLGLSLGAWTINKILNKFSGFLLLTASVLIYLLTGVFLISGVIAGFVSTLISLIVAGFLTSGLFAYAGNFNVTDQGRIVSPLYSADLFGGVAGSLMANFILIPLIGFGTSAQLMAFPSLFLFFFL
jgi:predicted membrane-bound spermidine synthase